MSTRSAFPLRGPSSLCGKQSAIICSALPPGPPHLSSSLPMCSAGNRGGSQTARLLPWGEGGEHSEPDEGAPAYVAHLNPPRLQRDPSPAEENAERGPPSPLGRRAKRRLRWRFPCIPSVKNRNRRYTPCAQREIWGLFSPLRRGVANSSSAWMQQTPLLG